jgi:3-oxoacyl-[acyl-carrier-protein] synthase III
MGVSINHIHALFGKDPAVTVGQNRTVFCLANRCLQEVMEEGKRYSHLLACTSCPDSISPSLGQCINEFNHDRLYGSHTLDIVQGCTGGVSAMIMASQLAEQTRGDILVIAADAAQKATSISNPAYRVFKNGAFGCSISYVDDHRGLIWHKSSQYKDLYEVVTIRLGHDADEVISENIVDLSRDPRKYLGLNLDNQLALKLMQKAEGFYLDFVAQTGHPDILILHQVNVPIINHLQKVFAKYPIHFINRAEETGNCGCATTGIVLDFIKHDIENKKVMICSFGTGGVITAGLWQF